MEKVWSNNTDNLYESYWSTAVITWIGNEDKYTKTLTVDHDIVYDYEQWKEKKDPRGDQ